MGASSADSLLDGQRTMTPRLSSSRHWNPYIRPGGDRDLADVRIEGDGGIG
ncbi:MAG: hypothetical protein ACXWWN_10855 [Gemmatimonadales bacterium]